MAVCKLRREPSPDASPAGILNLHCQSSELRKTKCPLFEPPALRYFVTAAEQTKVPAFPHLTLPVSVFHVLGHATLFHPGRCGHLTLSNAQSSSQTRPSPHLVQEASHDPADWDAWSSLTMRVLKHPAPSACQIGI